MLEDIFFYLFLSQPPWAQPDTLKGKEFLSHTDWLSETEHGHPLDHICGPGQEPYSWCIEGMPIRSG